MIVRVVATIAALAFSMVAPAGARPPVPASPVSTAGILASPNVELLLNIPDAGSVGGRFAGHYYFTTTVTGLRIYDVTDPELPVLTGALSLPHWENEDVDVSLSRKLVLISLDDVAGRRASQAGGALYVISWANPAAPQLLSRLQYPGGQMYKGKAVGGPGHIANCVKDCRRYAYITGARDSGSVQIVDLLDPSVPKIVGSFDSRINPAGAPNKVFTSGVVHDVDMDADGKHVWMTGSGGTAQLDVTNPLKPKPVRWVKPSDNTKTDHYIHHNSLRITSDTLLVTEEDYPDMCGENPVKPDHEGTFQTWKIDTKHRGAGTLTPLDQWDTELGKYIDGGAAVTVACSSHWFTYNKNKVVAVGWYDQGVRFLDVSNPRAIRQVGYWIRPTAGLGASAGLFVPGRPDLAYVADYNRGLDILKIADGGLKAKTVEAPVRSEWLAPKGSPSALRFANSEQGFRWMCLVPKPEDVQAALSR